MLKKLSVVLLASMLMFAAAPSFAGNHEKSGSPDEKACSKESKSCDRSKEKKCCKSESKLICPLVTLEKSKELALDKKQVKALTKIKNDAMSKWESTQRKIDQKNKSLVDDVIAGKLKDQALEKKVQEIASLQGELRLLKLRTHIKTVHILTPDQIKSLSNCDRKKKENSKKECASKKGCEMPKK
jgi:Spy/CpxP family protein refolding chaperone